MVYDGYIWSMMFEKSLINSSFGVVSTSGGDGVGVQAVKRATNTGIVDGLEQLPARPV